MYRDFVNCHLPLSLQGFVNCWTKRSSKWKAHSFQPDSENSILRSSVDPDNIPIRSLNDLPHFYLDCLKVWFSSSVRSKVIGSGSRHGM